MGAKQPTYPEQKIFGTNHYYYFHLSISLFHCAEFKKKIYNVSKAMRMHHFWAQNGPFAPNNFFLEKNNIIFIYLLAHFLCAKSKKILSGSSYEDMPFWSPKCPICPNEDFFRKKVNQSFSFDFFQSTC